MQSTVPLWLTRCLNVCVYQFIIITLRINYEWRWTQCYTHTHVRSMALAYAVIETIFLFHFSLSPRFGSATTLQCCIRGEISTIFSTILIICIQSERKSEQQNRTNSGISLTTIIIPEWVITRIFIFFSLRAQHSLTSRSSVLFYIFSQRSVAVFIHNKKKKREEKSKANAIMKNCF